MMLIWIIDEEWEDYDLEIGEIKEYFPHAKIINTSYDALKKGTDFVDQVDGILAQVHAKINRDLIHRCLKTKVISVYGTGTENIDLKACEERNIAVQNVTGYCSEDIAEYVMACVFDAHLKIREKSAKIDHDLQKGHWGFNTMDHIHHRLINQTILILGLGNIGKTVARKLQNFGMRVTAYDRRLNSVEMEKLGIEKVEWNEGLKTADFISVHLSGNIENTGLLGDKEFKMMKRGSVLINTSRGHLIDEKALDSALERGYLRAAYLDVLQEEPPPPDHVLLKNKRAIITPHISYISKESFQELKRQAVRNLIHILAGDPGDPKI